MKTLLLTALLLGAPVAASAQSYDELADANMVATAAPSAPQAQAAAYTPDAAPAPRARSVRVAAAPRSITIAIARSANPVVMADAHIGG